MHTFGPADRLRAQPGISRRMFLQGLGVLAAGGAALGAAGAALAQLPPPEVALETLDRTAFAAHVGEAFRVTLAPTSVALFRLVAVRSLGGADQSRSFSLLWSGPVAQAATQDQYRFEHDVMGSFPLFIVPQDADRRQQLYEAIFNR